MIYNEQNPLKVITLFSGYGSQELALSRLEREFPGFKYEIVRWAEFDPESTKPLDEQPAVIAYKALHPEAKDLNLGDMTKICWHKVKVEMATNTTMTFEEFFDNWCKEETNVTEVLNGGGYVYSGINYTTDENYHKCYTPIKEIDQMESGLGILFYSSPCQSISQAGLQHGFVEGSGTRSSLIWNVRDALKIMRPKYACLENVRAMVSDKFISMFNLWRNELTKLNYTNFAQVLNAADYGVPQNRERIFLFSIYDPDHTASYFFPEPFKLEKTIDDILEKDVDEKYYLNVVKVSEFVKENKAKIEEYGRKAKGEIEKLPERLRKMIEKQEKDAEEGRVIAEDAPILVKDENGNAVLDYDDEEQEISESFTEGDSATE